MRGCLTDDCAPSAARGSRRVVDDDDDDDDNDNDIDMTCPIGRREPPKPVLTSDIPAVRMGRGDDYVFHAGSMCGHNIVVVTLSAGQDYGTGSAAALP
ncbi:hypothetical protein TruAng_011926 [Truncatella angustata]|nr:hypothetical protein TruAng_011926 [Truncatella angustata]